MSRATRSFAVPNFKKNVLEGLSFTPIPDYFLAQIMTELSPTELRMMLYIYLHTVGYGKKADSIGYEQFINGITTRDGRLLDKGAGVSRRALVAALVSLEQKGLIERVQTRFNLSIIRLCLPPTTTTEEIVEGDNQLYITKVASDQALSIGEMVESDISTRPHKEKEVQILHSLEAQQVQNIPDEVQKLHSTIESSHEKHDNHDHDGDALSLTLSSQLALDAGNKQDLSSATLTLAKTSKSKSKSNEKPEPIIELMVSQVPELTLTNAQRLVRIARANGRSDSYLRDLVSHVTNNPRIHTPAAVLTALIKANEERSEKRPPATAPAKPRRKPLPINFEKYRRFQPKPEPAGNPGQDEDVACVRVEVFDNSGLSSSSSSSPFPNDCDCLPVAQAEVIGEKLSVASDNSIPADSRLKFALHERQPQLAAYLRETRIVPGSSGSGNGDGGDELVLRFIGKPASDNLDWWLPDVQIYHPTVRAIRVLQPV
jgi:DNA-binding MarR family transcriptional regulator